MQSVCELFNKQLSNLIKGPEDAAFKRSFYILDSLVRLASFVVVDPHVPYTRQLSNPVSSMQKLTKFTYVKEKILQNRALFACLRLYSVSCSK